MIILQSLLTWRSFLLGLNGLLPAAPMDSDEAKPPGTPNMIDVNGQTIDFDNLELENGDEIVQLTLMETKLLQYLIENEGRAISAKRSSKRCGSCRKTPTRGRSTILSFGCERCLKTNQTIPESCRPFAASAIVFKTNGWSG